MKLPKVRARTLASGAVLGGALMVGLGLVGGVGRPPIPFEERPPDRPGLVTAIQPKLREALLTDEDLPAAPEPTPTAPVEPAAPTVTVPAPVTDSPRPETGAIGELCRVLFGDGAGLVDLWSTRPRETTSRHTESRGGGSLHQLLGVFDAERAVEAYRQLRESAAGCDRFEATLSDGDPVTVLLAELTADRTESVTADDTYTVRLTLEGGTPAGWLSVDRVGPVVLVLRHLGPDADRGDITKTRHAALDKLRLLLRTLRDQ